MPLSPVALPQLSNDFRDKRILCMGLGAFGGGCEAVRYFASRGANVTVTDTRSATQLTKSITELQDFPNIKYRLDGHEEKDFRNADMIIVNPAVKRDHPLLELAVSLGITLTSEMNLFWQLNPAPVVGVTGSNGKSTTTALIYSIMSQTNRRCWLGGNIGVSLLPMVDQIRQDDLVILELSSFQLADLDRINASPDVAVVTNFASNHLDWHNSLEHYRESKQSILRWQETNSAAILNADDSDVVTWPTRGKRLFFGSSERPEDGVFEKESGALIRISHTSQTWPIRDWLKLPGRHNMANALAATCAAVQLGAKKDEVRKGIEQYKPLPHRLQFLGTIRGRTFYNDSLATTPESTEVAIEAFDCPIVLLAGGYDKKVDLSRMANAIATKVKAVALMGQTAQKIKENIESTPANQCLTSQVMTTFEESFNWAYSMSSPGDAIVLSPGCASYDWFRNFEDRGMQFERLVKNMEAETRE